MCGISGFIDNKKTSSAEILKKMSATLSHRGPDAEGFFFIDENNVQVGLAHKRLSILDLSETGRQPMQFEHACISFNGEIYNFKEIRKELEILGHKFKGNSDTEVILHAYTQWKEQCLDKFIGMFAFVIYNRETSELFCGRDRAGVKPFFYYHHNGLFMFASELKVFHEHPRFKKEINFKAVTAFMQFGNVPAPHCIFNYCYKLQPGHFLKFNLHKDVVEIRQYWNVYDAYNQPKQTISFTDAKQKTEEVLKSAFEYRMVSDVPVGVFLSGGYDSACLTALLQKNRTEKLKTFTIGVPDIGLDEAPDAKKIASHLGTDHNEIYCTEKEVLDFFSVLPHYYDEPFGDQSAIPTSLVCKMARRQVTVALSADGGDEVFAGYNRYDYLLKYGSALNRTPAFLRRGFAGLMEKIPAEKVPVMRKKYNFPNRYHKLKMLLSDPSPKNMMWNMSKQFSEAEITRLLLKEAVLPATAYQSAELQEDFFTPLSYMMALDYQTYLPDDILQKVDRASMIHSLEAREPFLDHRIIEWAATLPDEYKYNKGIKKYILREIVHDYIPKDMMDRPKKGFAIPLEKWLDTSLKEKVRFYLSEDRINAQGIFNSSEINNLTTSFYSGKKELALKVWYLLVFQLWHEKWMN